MDTSRILTTIALAIGTMASAFATDIIVQTGDYAIERALQKAREERRMNGATDVTIKLQSGTYRLDRPIIVRPEDNNTRIVAEGDVTISGGVRITNWKKQGKLYVADVPDFNGRPLEFRQLWVNGVKAIRANDVNNDFEKMFRIVSMDKQKEVLYVPTAAFVGADLVSARTHHTAELVSSAQPGGHKVRPYEIKGLEMVLHEMWCIANLRIKYFEVLGDSTAVYFHQPESHIHFMHPWPSPMVTTDGHNSAFYLTNAKELLDSPGEWYLDARASKVYYMPRKGENMATADVEVPAVETLLKTEATPDNPVKNVTFEGIRFSHSTWMRPSIEGHAPLQAGMYMIEAYKLRPKTIRPNGDHKLDNQGWVGRPASAVEINCAEDVNFMNCTFEHIASTGLDYHLYIKGGIIENCTFRDIGGNGILAGTFGPEGHEAHLPYLPTDERIICNGLNITNNLITDVTNEDWGCIGIGAGFVRNIVISHNEISDVSYTGISVGWGWNRQPCAMANNKILNNLIHHYARHMYDTAGIYTLGSQPLSYIEGNVVRDIYTPSYVHDPHHWFYLYTDEGSSFITVQNNWTPEEKFLKNANGPGNTWENNGPMVSDSIKISAGRIK